MPILKFQVDTFEMMFEMLTTYTKLIYKVLTVIIQKGYQSFKTGNWQSKPKGNNYINEAPK